MDVDVCHYSKNPLRIGGQWEHTAGHCKNGIMVCSHEWVEGVIDYYHFTGDERGLETAISIGDNILRLLDTPMYANREKPMREKLAGLYVHLLHYMWRQEMKNGLQNASGLLTALRYGKRSMATGLLHIRTILL